MSTPALLGVTALVLFLLALIFPREALIQRMIGGRAVHENDLLAARYGAGMVRESPRNEPLRQAVAERQADVGELERARATLSPLRASSDPAVRRDAILKEREILLELIAATDASPEARAPLFQSLRALLESALAELWPESQLLAFARESVARGWNDLAGRFYRRLIETVATPAPASVREAVDHFLGQRDYAQAAELHFILMRRAPDVATRSAQYRAALVVLEAANRPAEAALVARRELGNLVDDPAAFAAMVRLATAAGDWSMVSELHFLARERATSLAARRASFLAGVRALQSADRLDLALAAAEQRLGDLADDEETLTFLVRLARTANDQQRAQAWARRLMRFGDATPPGRSSLAQALLEPLVRVASFLVNDARAQGAAVTLRPYSEGAYGLAYDVFVGNGNFADARRVAEAALAQRPADVAWRERLARVCEWMGDAAEALRQWMMLAESTGSDRALEAILRLAPGLGEDEALLGAWRTIAARRRLADAEMRTVAELFERTGRVDEGLAFFGERAERDRSNEALALVGWLAARSGRTGEAIAAYEALAARGALDLDRAITLSTLHFSQGDFRAALATLERVRDRVPPNEVEYWRLYGDLAWRLGDDAASGRAYDALNRLGKLEPFEFARLLRLMRPTRPAEAARLAEAAWRQTRDPQFFYVAAEIHAARRDLPALDRLFRAVELADEPRFRNDAFFFTLRSNWHAWSGRPRPALDDFKRALALRPADPDLKAQFLWQVIDLRETSELRDALRAWHRETRTAPVLWPAFAAGYQTLGEPRSALPFYRLALPDRKDDYLWLLGYADALEDAGETGIAWRIRRHAWHAIRGRIASRTDPATLPDELVAYARMATRYAPGDRSLAAVRGVLSQAREARSGTTGGARTLDAIARELALGYAIQAGEFDRARAWLWLQYGRALTRPRWGELAVALDANDLETMDRLLAEGPDKLPRYDRVEAARALEYRPLAQTLAWESLERYPADDEMHLRLDHDLRANAWGVVAEASAYRYAFLRGTDKGLRLDAWVTPRLRLAPFVREISQRSRDDTQLVNVPATDRRAGLQAEWRTASRRVQVEAAERSAMRDFTSFEALVEERVRPRLTLRASAGTRLYANETAALRVGGTRDDVRLGALWNFAKREYANLTLSSARYHTQARTEVGDGQRIELEAGHRLRTDHPNLTARVYGGYQWFSRARTTDEIGRTLSPAGTTPAGDFFLPPSFAFYAAAIGFGQELREHYSRGVRPFADVGVSYNTVIGTGYSALAGVGGSVLGADHLSAGIARSKGGLSSNTLYQEIFVRYQLLF
jgi:Tfp pilus assembly protein PilF